MSTPPSVQAGTPLFRDAALARFSSSAWQPALLSKPVSGYLLAACATLAGLGLVGFANTFEFARKEQVQGYLTPASGWTRLKAKSFGVVHRRFVAPGDSVQLGDVLLEVSSGDGLQQDLTVQDQMLEEIQGRRAALQARLRLLAAEHEQNLRLLSQQNLSDRKKLSRLGKEIRLSKANVEIAQKRRQDGQQLVSSGYLSLADLTTLEEELRMRLLSLSQRQGEAEQLQAHLATNEMRWEKLAVERDLKQALIQEQLHALAMDESRLRNEGAFRYLAPRNGAVASVRVRAGDSVQPGTVLLDIVPEDGVLQGRRIELRGGIRLRSLSFSYGEEEGSVLDAVDLEITAGEFVSISGASGKGKTTLIKLLAKLLTPTEGEILVDGVDLRQLDEGTAHLNEELQRPVLDDLAGLGITIVAVTHDPRVLSRADRQLSL